MAKNKHAAALGRLGGKAKWAKISKADRSVMMRDAVRKRWANWREKHPLEQPG
jgi:hypothetical protein